MHQDGSKILHKTLGAERGWTLREFGIFSDLAVRNGIMLFTLIDQQEEAVEEKNVFLFSWVIVLRPVDAR